MIEIRGSGSKETPSVGAPPFEIAFPAWATNWAIALDGARCRLDSGHALDRREDRLGNRVAYRSAVAVGELGDPADLEVDVLVDVAEQRREGVVQGVGQDERAGDEGHTEHDRDARSAPAGACARAVP